MSVADAQRVKTPTPNGEKLSQTVLRQRIEAIAVNAGARAEETAKARCVPLVTMNELKEAGLMRVRQPKRWGGLGRPWLELYELAHTLAQACGSTGWVYCVLAGHSGTVSDFPIEAQEDVWGQNPEAIASSAFMPRGEAQPVAGGFRLNGSFPFSSGCDHAQWAIVGSFISMSGKPTPHIFLVPISELVVVDDWHTLGLQGTGSKTLIGKDVFVPTHRVIPMPQFAGSVAPFSLQSVMIGSALGGLKAFIADTKTKPGQFGGPPPAQSEYFQGFIGESWGDLNAAWTLLAEAVTRTEEVAPGNAVVPPDRVRINRMTNAVISRLCVGAIQRVYELSGAHGVYDGHLSRAMRDVLAAAQHASLNPHVAARLVGAHLLSNAG